MKKLKFTKKEKKFIWKKNKSGHYRVYDKLMLDLTVSLSTIPALNSVNFIDKEFRSMRLAKAHLKNLKRG
tara:strand:+ start:222 stop:431 length:210 start_codon:yes stop_codon:yes gene_type:complete